MSTVTTVLALGQVGFTREQVEALVQVQEAQLDRPTLAAETNLQLLERLTTGLGLMLAAGIAIAAMVVEIL